MKKFEAFVKKIWTDPILSKILGSIGYAALAYLAGVMAPWHILEYREVVLAIALVLFAEVLLLFLIRRPMTRVVAPSASACRYYRATVRRWATILAFSVPVLVPALGLSIAYLSCHANDRMAIYVANFESKDSQASYRVTRKIFERLRESLSSYSDAHPKLLNKSVPWHAKDPAAILTWCQRQENSILIWGDLDTTQRTALVNTHVQVIRSMNPWRGWNERRSPLADLESFDLQDRLSSESSYVTLLLAGQLHFEHGDYHGAIDRLTDAIRQVGNEYNLAHAYFARGRAYYAIGDFAAALSDYSYVIRSRRDYPNALVNRGACYVALGSYNQGVQDLTAAIGLDPTNYRAYLNRGGAYYSLGRFDEALDDYKRAITNNRTSINAYIGCGNAYDHLGRFEQALEDYNHAEQIDDKYPDVYVERAIAYARRKNYVLALRDIDTALRLAPTYDGYRIKGMVLHQSGHDSEAITSFREARRLAKSDDQLRNIDSFLADLTQD